MTIDADRIERDLDGLDTSNIARQNLVELSPQEDCLVIVLENELELKFLKKLCEREPLNNLAIDVWIQVGEYLKPLSKMNLTFKNIQQIHSYNPDLKIGIYRVEENKIFKLNLVEELILP